MDKKDRQKTYWQEFYPLWWDEIKSWFGWTDFLSTFIKSGIQVIAVLIIFLAGGSAENFFETAAIQFVTYFLIFLFIEVILLITYHRASKKLFESLEGNVGNLESKLIDIENSKPVIRAKNPVVAEKGFHGGIKKSAVSITVSNISPNSVAEKVYPTVTWLTPRGRKVTENQGRWWISNEDKVKLKTVEMQTVDLYSNGMTNDLHFAIQEPDENHFYAWSREKDGSEKFTPLHDEKYKVRIHFQSSNNAVADFEYVVKNNNGKLSVREVSK